MLRKTSLDELLRASKSLERTLADYATRIDDFLKADELADAELLILEKEATKIGLERLDADPALPDEQPEIEKPDLMPMGFAVNFTHARYGAIRSSHSAQPVRFRKLTGVGRWS